MQIRESDALLIIDVQNDFCPGGALPVPRGDEVVSACNALSPRFPVVVLTQDWHPPDQISFASAHGRRPYEEVELAYGRQVLWPDHCVQGTEGAAFHPDLDTTRAALVLRKGMHATIDSYSAFRENDRATRTGLEGWLRERGVRRVFLAGLAQDFCVRWSALDAHAAGLEVVVVDDAVRGIDLNGSVASAWQELGRVGVGRASTSMVGV